MIKNNEKTILRLVKIGPLFVVFFAIAITSFMLFENNKLLEKEIEKERIALIEQEKDILKIEIERVYDYIISEKKQSINQIKKITKQRVLTAHTIATSIYKNNQDKSKELVKKLIKDALRDIRFYDSNSYFFIDDLDGINILHPISPSFEGKNIISFKDKKGNYLVKQMIDLVKAQDEGPITWWWTKPEDKTSQYEKIGYAKLFKPFNWVIGTGEYVIDHENRLKEKVLERINNIKYGIDGYIFAYDYKGNTLSHVKKSLLGTNRYNLIDKKGNYLVQDIIKAAKKGDAIMHYVGTIQPSTGKPAEKISYIKGLQKWEWVIGTGTYISELEETINKKKQSLKETNEEVVIETLIISSIASILTFLLSIFFARTIENKFNDYKDEVETLNDSLEQKVKKRTSELKKANIKLKDTLESLTKTKEDLIASEKMAMLGELVGNITHEINTPLGMGITSMTHIQSLTKNIIANYEKEEMTQEEFESFLKDLDELSKIVSINLKNSSQLINSFKNVAVDQAIEEKRQFDLKNYINEILLSLKNKTKKTKLTIDVNCDDNIVLNSYPNYIFQILTNFINNSILHGFDKDQEGKIEINVENLEDSIKLTYKDNGKGIPQKLIKDIFKQYFTTKRGSGGTGLGLHIVEKIVTEKLKGTIKFNSPENNGVEFEIIIPRNID